MMAVIVPKQKDLARKELEPLFTKGQKNTETLFTHGGSKASTD
jgi:hypothetical protein